MNILATIAPKSDQLNADDLTGRTMTIKVREVSVRAGEDQPVSFFFEGDDGKPFKPCKSMRRVIVNAWGADTSAYVGRSMTLFCDPNVTFGKEKVGGIRISHLSDIESDLTMALTVTRANRKPYTVKQMAVPADAAEKYATSFIAKLDDLLDHDEVAAFEQEKSAKLTEMKAKRPDQYARIVTAIAARRAEFDEQESDQPPATSSTSQQEDEIDHAVGSQDEADAGAASDTDEGEVWRGMVDGWKSRMSAKHTVTDITELRSEFNKNAWVLPDDVNAEIDGLLTEAAYKFTTGE